MRSKWRVYLKPFDDYGAYTDWVEVTEDVDFQSVGSIAQDLDNTEYDIGVFRYSNFTLSLRNDHGKYSDVGTLQTMFRSTRSNTLCKVTWDIEPEGSICGFAEVDRTYLSEEQDVFVGLLNDESLEMDLDDQKVKFKVLGRESIFMKTVVPFDTLNAGDLISDVIYKVLNQSKVTAILTVSAANIAVGLDQSIDSLASLQNKTVQEGLNKLLLASNSVLYIYNDTVYVQPRAATESVMFEFFGQASAAGAENIEKIAKIRNGLARAFNYLTWKDTTLVASDDTSLTKYGVRKREVDFEFYTNDVKRLNVLGSLLDEFKTPKQEFDLSTFINYDTFAIRLLDRISIDYPTIPISDFPLPICGTAVSGEAVMPNLLWSFTIAPTEHYKVIGRSIDIKSSIIKFKMRAI